MHKPGYEVEPPLDYLCIEQRSKFVHGLDMHDRMSKFKAGTGHRWIPMLMASDAKLQCFLWFAPEQTIEQTMKTSVIWEAMALFIMSP